MKKMEKSPPIPKAIKQVTAQQQIIQFSSPIPPPEILALYEKTHAGLINEIVELTKIQNDHRRNLENKQIDAQIIHQEKRDSEAKCGQIFAFIISLVAIACSMYTAIKGHGGAASAIGLVGLTGLAARFINGRSIKNVA